MAQERKRRLPAHSQTKGKRMNISEFETVLQEIDYVEKSWTLKIQRSVQNEVQREFRRCGLSTVGNQIGSLVERMETLEQRVSLQEQALERMNDLSGSVVKKIEELHETTGENHSNIQMLSRNSRKLALMGLNHEQRLVQLEEGEGAVVGSGISKAPTGEGGNDRNGGKARCPFCGKELTIKYLGTHMKQRCKKAAGIYAAAALYEQAPESPHVISDVRFGNADGNLKFE